MTAHNPEPAASVRIQSVDRAVDLLLAVAAAQPAAAERAIGDESEAVLVAGG